MVIEVEFRKQMRSILYTVADKVDILGDIGFKVDDTAKTCLRIKTVRADPKYPLTETRRAQPLA